MRFTRTNAAVAALLGASLVWLIGLWTVGPAMPALQHLMLFAVGGIVGAVDLYLLSILSRRKG